MQLQELSLRGNPLVVRFVKDMTYDPPSLLELAGRTVKSRNLSYSHHDLPTNLVYYLDMASKCPNPKCAGGTLVIFRLHLACIHVFICICYFFGEIIILCVQSTTVITNCLMDDKYDALLCLIAIKNTQKPSFGGWLYLTKEILATGTV